MTVEQVPSFRVYLAVFRLDAMGCSESGHRLYASPEDGVFVDAIHTDLEIPYPAFSRRTIELRPGTARSLPGPTIEVRHLPKRTYLLVQKSLPHATPETRASAAMAVSEVASLVGLVAPGALGECVFEDVSCTPDAFALVPEVPLQMTASQVSSPQSLSAALDEGIRCSGSLAAESRDSFRLAARWYTRGLGSRSAVDKYLSLWIALEVFPAGGGLRVSRSVSEYLATKAFPHMDPSKLKSVLGLGRVEGLRGDLVHKGWAFPPADDLKFFECLHRLEIVVGSCLRVEIGLPPLPHLAALVPSPAKD